MNVGRDRGGRALLAEINVTPMADVIIVLLIIFMVAIPILDRPPVALPSALHATDGPKDELTIVVRADGAVAVGDLPALSMADVTSVLRSRRTDASPAVRIEAARDADYATVARVLEACRQAGVEQIGLAVEPGPGRRARPGTS